MAAVLSLGLRKRARWSRQADGTYRPQLGGYPVGRVTMTCCGGQIECHPAVARTIAEAAEGAHSCAGI